MQHGYPCCKQLNAWLVIHNLLVKALTRFDIDFMVSKTVSVVTIQQKDTPQQKETQTTADVQ